MSKINQRYSRDFDNSNTPRQPYPAVSVIIPLYNSERYIGECLESVLAQTFNNYEVIVVNDCSTDNSAAIVENYIEKFGGRLKLLHMDKNSGSGGLPRNKGTIFSRGEYVYFVDADDLIIQTALEELYTLAKDYDADVVYCEKYYLTDPELNEINIFSGQQCGFVDKPTFASENLAERIQEVLSGYFGVETVLKFVRRDLMIANGIFFPNIKPSEDDIWTYELILCAKKFLRVPNIVYAARQTKTSVMRSKRTPLQELTFWLTPLIFGLKSLDEFMGRIEFFQRNPAYRIAILDHLGNRRCFDQISRYCSQLSPVEIYETIKHDFGKNFGEQSILLAYLCTLIHEQRKNLKLKDEQIQRLLKQIEKN